MRLTVPKQKTFLETLTISYSHLFSLLTSVSKHCFLTVAADFRKWAKVITCRSLEEKGGEVFFEDKDVDNLKERNKMNKREKKTLISCEAKM